MNGGHPFIHYIEPEACAELRYVSFSELGAQLLFAMCSTPYEPRAAAITINLPFAEWTQVFGNPSSRQRCWTG